jgi:hypothetical protein
MRTLLNEIINRNKILGYLGAGFLLITILLSLYSFVNPIKVLGINSMIKPIKFCISTVVYAWTMAYLLYYVHNQKRVFWYSVLATVVMIFENSVIIGQAFRGRLSHFNQTELIGGILYGLMGIMIVWLTTATLVITIRFIAQKSYSIDPPFVLSIKIGLILFVVFSFFGGYMSVINSHNIGGEMGKDGLPLLNWSSIMGDLRVGHFFGIHSLQFIPLIGYFVSNRISDPSQAKLIIWVGTMLYVSFVSFTIYQALQGCRFSRFYAD